MKVFISWSGERSKQLGEAIHRWLRRVLQAVEPYISSVDIAKGARWYSDIVDTLEKSDVGLIILTQESLASQWMMFEAGAIARSVEQARVCPILFGIKETDLRGPLSFFQATEFTEANFRALLSSINERLEKPLVDTDLTAVFDQWWPDLQKSLNLIMAATQSAEPVPQKRPADELLEESLLLMRRLDRQQQENDQMLRQLFSAIVTPVGPTGPIPVGPSGQQFQLGPTGPTGGTHFGTTASRTILGTANIAPPTDLKKRPRLPLDEGLTAKSEDPNPQ